MHVHRNNHDRRDFAAGKTSRELKVNGTMFGRSSILSDIFISTWTLSLRDHTIIIFSYNYCMYGYEPGKCHITHEGGIFTQFN